MAFYSMTPTDMDFINMVYQRCMDYNPRMTKGHFAYLNDDGARNMSKFLDLFKEVVNDVIKTGKGGVYLPKLDCSDLAVINITAYFAIGILKYGRSKYNVFLRIERINPRDKALVFMVAHPKIGLISSYCVFKDNQGSFLRRMTYSNGNERYVNDVQRLINITSKKGI